MSKRQFMPKRLLVIGLICLFLTASSSALPAAGSARGIEESTQQIQTPAGPSAASTWSMTLWSTADENANSITPTSDGAFIVVGDRMSSSGMGWVAKVDSAGTVIWQKVANSANWSGFQSIAPAQAGGYYLSGYNAVEWVVKLDASGNVLWQKAYSLSLDPDGKAAILPTTDGGLVLVGMILEGSGDIFTPVVGIAKLDSAGNVTWAREYATGGATPGAFVASSIVAAPDSYIVIGQCYNGTNLVGCLFKINTSGTLVWQKSFAHFAKYIAPTNDGSNYVVVGSFGMCQ